MNKNLRKMLLGLAGCVFATGTAFGGHAVAVHAESHTLSTAQGEILSQATVAGEVGVWDSAGNYYQLLNQPGQVNVVEFTDAVGVIALHPNTVEVSFDETDPSTVAANAAAACNCQANIIKLPDDFGTLNGGSQAAPAQQSQPQAAVSPATASSTSAIPAPPQASSTPCTSAGAGLATPVGVYSGGKFVCGGLPQINQPYIFGSDIFVAPSITPQTPVPAGYYCDGPIQVPGQKYYRSNDHDVELTAITSDHSDITTGWGADCNVGGSDAMWQECLAKLNETGTVHTNCVFFVDPPQAAAH